MRVLVLSPRIPFPPVDGAGLRTHHLLRALSERHDVTLLAFDYGDGHEVPQFPVELVAVPWEWPDSYRAMHAEDPAEADGAFAELNEAEGEPWFVSCVASTAFEAAMHEAVERGIDVAVLEESSMGRFLPSLPAGCPTVLDMHNVHTRMALREAADDLDARREAGRTQRYETALAARCSLVVTVSELEETAARGLLGADRVEVVPNGVDTAAYIPTAAGSGAEVLFVGRMDYAPNVDAVVHFAAEMWPAVRERVPGAVFHVVGTDPLPEIQAVAAADIVVHGRVEDVRPHYERADLFVAPLRSGGGTRLKLLEAAACGKAIVTTSIGMEGLQLQPGRDVIVADRPAAFAAATADLLLDPDRRRALGRGARGAALAYDWDAIGARFLTALEGLATGEPRRVMSGAAR
jgi:glycosyltransferase involved in cell wall biosynthesis